MHINPRLNSLLVISLISSIPVLAQLPLKPRISPLDMATIIYEDTYVKITYSRPSKEGRNIFGELVPYDQLWKTGDNEATEITTNKKILIGADTLQPGTYSLFTIPHEESWTIIINNKVGLWGDFRYNEKYDLFRFEAAVENTDKIYEPFTIEFSKEILPETELYLIWERTKVTIPIKFLSGQ